MKNMARKIFTQQVAILVVVVTLFVAGALFAARQTVNAARVVLDNGNLYTLGETVGQKRLTQDGNVKLLFDHRSNLVLYGQGWQGVQPDTYQFGGTHLWLMRDDGSHTRQVSTMPVNFAFLDATGAHVYFTTLDFDLYVADTQTLTATRIVQKVAQPNLSADGNYLVYQKLNADWQRGQYFDKALGLALYTIATKQERMLTATSGDFLPLWTPDGTRVLFFSPSPEGLESHFVVRADGSGRTQLTNVGQKLVSDATVRLPSEKPIWSSDGKYLVYESDKEIWMNEFSPDGMSVRSARRIAYGTVPTWVRDGQQLSIRVSGKDLTVGGLVTITLDGTIIH